MAKKKESLSFEERLKKTLIPDWEQPYKVPENWVWTKLPMICKHIKAGGDKPKNISSVKNEINTIPVVANGISNDGIIGYTDIAKSEKDTITVSARGTIGFSVIRNYEYYPIVRLIVIKAQDKINYKLLKYYFDNFIEEGTGSSIPQLTVPMLADKPFPLPPPAEQHRIVDRIESMFSKLDEAKEKVQNSLDSFENRKAAILHKAFTGELTPKWRKENSVSLDSWEETILDQVCDKITDGTHKSPENSLCGEFMYITAKNIKEDGISLANITYVSKKDFQEIYSRCNVEKNDVLYIKDGATTGIATINQLAFPFAMLSSVALLKPKKEVANPKYIAYYLNAPRTKAKMISNMSGNAITRLTLTKIKASSIIMPTPPEQTEIVRILDNVFEKERQAKKLVSVIGKIDLMKKTILARAFRGELGTNDPEEESAMELLEEILEVKF